MNAHDPHLAEPRGRRITDADRLVGLRIASLRKAGGFSRATLGAAIGVTFQQIEKYEVGRNRVGAGRLQAVARFFDVPVASFFEGADDRPGSGERAEILTILREPGAIDLLTTYAAIPDAAMRRQVLALLRTTLRLSRGPTPEPEAGA
ncbi:helix-turn-helix domain-containing protein [Methylorubrum sp. POS3]|uniref:helix-turn-helix domain-containing protein n=1 Tax=Methylorubrum sp. POS3 TaxID=2998492 RepID=UPI00372AAC3F